MTVGEVSSLSMPLSRRLLCGAYSAIALAALLLTWRNGGPHDVAGALDFWRDAKANNSTRFIAVDVLMFGLAAGIWMVVEARKWSIRFVWGYLLAAFVVDVSVAFPLFLIARELRMNDAEPPALRTVDKVLLPLLAAAILGLCIWVDQ